MSDEIKVGDLVRVAYPTKCCGNSSHIGIIFVVKEIFRKQYTYCIFCRHEVAIDLYVKDSKYSYSLEELKKIDPESEPVSHKIMRILHDEVPA